jgi:hypothetical protein
MWRNWSRKVGRGNRSTGGNPASAPISPQRIPHDMTYDRPPGRHGGKPCITIILVENTAEIQQEIISPFHLAYLLAFLFRFYAFISFPHFCVKTLNWVTFFNLQITPFHTVLSKTKLLWTLRIFHKHFWASLNYKMALSMDCTIALALLVPRRPSSYQLHSTGGGISVPLQFMPLRYLSVWIIISGFCFKCIHFENASRLWRNVSRIF